MIQEVLSQRNLPDLLHRASGQTVQTQADWQLRRTEILDVLSREIYGYAPEPPAEVTGTVISRNEDAFAHKAAEEKIEISFETPGGRYAFPVNLIIPYSKEKPPVFLLLNFRPDVPDLYFPAEEIIDRGYAAASVYYNDITQDSIHFPEQYDSGEYFNDKLAALYPREGPSAWGKISLWAWALSRVLDVLVQRDDLDKNRIAVIGHSRLGKTALWAAAQDERFSAVMANNSGCGGDALFRGTKGETIRDITGAFPYWFCDRFREYAGRESELPLDQHALLACLAPRGVCLGAAAEDLWADPVSQFLSGAAASFVWEINGEKGLVSEDRMPETGDKWQGGKLAYHLRAGSHYLSRTDWNHYIDYRERHNV